MSTYYRWLVVAVVATAVVAFVAGAALMGGYAHEQQKQHAAQQQKESPPAGEGLVGGVPGAGDAAEKAARPVVHPLCRGAVQAQPVPVLGQVVVFTVDGVARAAGTGGCSA